jgi:hypothetical protein
MKECYREINFKKATLAMIELMNTIILEYFAGGYVLTVRQLYYQLVARDIVPNTEKSYKYVARTINDARIAGLIDWDAIEDRTRSFEQRSRWDEPTDILIASAKQYHTDPWLTQDYRPFVVVEKEALSGVFSRVCHEYDVPLLAARGYPSVSVIREFVERQVLQSEQHVVILHFGDHDPSGIDMTRDLEERLTMFCRDEVEFTMDRLALNIDQINKHKPPPNPAKQTDTRFSDYKRKFGVKSWELDALNPEILTGLARKAIDSYIDASAWKKWKTGLEKTRKRMLDYVEQFE